MDQSAGIPLVYEPPDESAMRAPARDFRALTARRRAARDIRREAPGDAAVRI